MIKVIKSFVHWFLPRRNSHGLGYFASYLMTRIRCCWRNAQCDNLATFHLSMRRNESEMPIQCWSLPTRCCSTPHFSWPGPLMSGPLWWPAKLVNGLLSSSPAKYNLKCSLHQHQRCPEFPSIKNAAISRLGAFGHHRPEWDCQSCFATERRWARM